MKTYVGGTVSEGLRDYRAGNFCDLLLADRARGTERSELDGDTERLGSRNCRGHVRPGVAFNEWLDRELQQQHDLMVERLSPTIHPVSV